MRSLAGDKRIHAFSGGRCQLGACAAADHADAPAEFRSAGNYQRLGARCPPEPGSQFRARNPGLGLEPDRPAVVEEKGAQRLQAERGAEPGVVAQRGVGVQREMRAIDGEIVIYMNRLSDLLFTMARFVNFKEKKVEIIWRRK